MREMLDCGVLLPPGHDAAMRGWIERHQPQVARVRFHPCCSRARRGRRTAGAGGHGRDAQALRCLPDAGRAGHAGLDPHRLAAGAAVPGHAHPGAGRRHEGVGHRGPAGAGRGRFHFRTRLPGRVARALAPSAAVGCVGLAAASLEEPALRYGAQGQAVLAPVGLPPHRPARCPLQDGAASRARKQAARRRPRRVHAWRRPCSTRPWRACGCCPAGRTAASHSHGQGTRGGRVRARVPAARTLPSRRQRGAGRQGVQQAPPRILGVDAQARYKAAPYRIAAARRGQDMPSD